MSDGAGAAGAASAGATGAVDSAANGADANNSAPAGNSSKKTAESKGNPAGDQSRSTDNSNISTSKAAAKTKNEPGKGDAGKPNVGTSESKSADTKPAAEETKPAPRKLADTDLDALVTVKIDGEVKELTVRELQKLSQLEQVSRKKMSEADAKQKKLETLFDLFHQDPFKFKEVTGIDTEEWAENIIAKKFEEMQMTPEQKEVARIKRENEEFKARDAQSKAQVLDELREVLGGSLPKGIENHSKEELQQYLGEKKAEFKSAQDGLEKEFLEAWQETKLPKNKFFGTWMAQAMISHQKRTGSPLQAKEAAAKVKTQFLQCVSETVSEMDAAAIQELLGKATVEKLRSHDIQALQAANDPLKNETKPRENIRRDKPRKPMNEREWIEYMQK